MSNDTRLTVYELGIIKNFLRDQLISIKIKEFSVDYPAENEKEKDERACTFGLELTAIRDKVEVMISNRLDGNNQLITILPNSKFIAKRAGIL